VRRFRLDVSRKTGITTLWMSTEQSPCGYTPLISWSSIHGLREFSEMLLDMYRHNIRENERIKQTSDSILQKVFSDRESNEGDNNDS
jgi:hypothetical protein